MTVCFLVLALQPPPPPPPHLPIPKFLARAEIHRSVCRAGLYRFRTRSTRWCSCRACTVRNAYAVRVFSLFFTLFPPQTTVPLFLIPSSCHLLPTSHISCISPLYCPLCFTLLRSPLLHCSLMCSSCHPLDPHPYSLIPCPCASSSVYRLIVP